MNINDYFDKLNIQTLTTEKTFDFITDINIPLEKVDDTLKNLLEQNVTELENMTGEEKRKLEIDDKVFQNIYIPRTLQEMSLEELDKMSQSKFATFSDFFKPQFDFFMFRPRSAFCS